MSAILSLINIYLLIAYFSMLVWFLPLVKQRNTKYFGFFLIYSLIDPITRLVFWAFNLMPLTFYPAFILLSALALTNNYKNIRFLFGVLLTLIISILLGLNLFWLYIICILGTTLILFILINHLIVKIYQEHTINLFLCAFILFQFVSIIKLIVILLNFYSGVTSFFLATISQIFFALLFSLVNFNTKNYPLKAKKK